MNHALNHLHKPLTGAALRLRALGIDTLQEFVVFMRRDCHVCRAEGFQAQTRVQVHLGERHIVATLNVIDSELLASDEAGLSNSAWRALRAKSHDTVTVSRAPTLESHGALRAKIYGHRLDAADYNAIMRDIAEGHYSEVYMAAFLSACAGGRMDLQETIDMTRAMVAAGETIAWNTTPIADKHCVGGLPGNRTTPIVVAIAAAAGLITPKTSSRAITSPAGTADVMETITNVTLDVPSMRRVVEQEGGCLVWGGTLTLSPADDMLIRVEQPLDVDSDAQLVASVLSKKLAAGATHVIIDIPVGPTAKVRSEADAQRVQILMEQVAAACGLHMHVVRTDGTQPVGRGIGPALEARDVLAVLRRSADAPPDLRAKSLYLAGELLEFSGKCAAGAGPALALDLLDSGAALRKFEGICKAQGRLSEPGTASLREPVLATQAGRVTGIDNRRLSRVAKLLGAPTMATAGVDLHVHLGDIVTAGTPLFTLHAEAPGELAYARDYLNSHPVMTLTDGTAS